MRSFTAALAVSGTDVQNQGKLYPSQQVAMGCSLLDIAV